MLLPETKVLTHHYTPTGILHHDPYVTFSPNIKSQFDVYPLLVLTTFHILIHLILMLTCEVIILDTKTWENSNRLASLFSVAWLITDSTEVLIRQCAFKILLSTATVLHPEKEVNIYRTLAVSDYLLSLWCRFYCLPPLKGIKLYFRKAQKPTQRSSSSKLGWCFELKTSTPKAHGFGCSVLLCFCLF